MQKTSTPGNHGRIVNYLFKSDFYEIKNWTLDFDRTTSFETEFNDCLCVVHTHRGALTKKAYQLTTGQVTLERPDFEYQLLPSRGSCTIINFTDNFYFQMQELLQIDGLLKKHGRDMLSIKATASPASELVLHALLNSLPQADTVLIDGLVLDFFSELLNTTWNTTSLPCSHEPHNSLHLAAIENVKEFLHKNFSRSISLADLSRHCGISLFYLSRLFKRYTTHSPYNYLLTIRLKHGEMLVKNTTDPIADIAYACGFTSPEYFCTLFKQKYKEAPSVYRKIKRR